MTVIGKAEEISTLGHELALAIGSNDWESAYHHITDIRENVGDIEEWLPILFGGGN